MHLFTYTCTLVHTRTHIIHTNAYRDVYVHMYFDKMRRQSCNPHLPLLSSSFSITSVTSSSLLYLSLPYHSIRFDSIQFNSISFIFVQSLLISHSLPFPPFLLLLPSPLPLTLPFSLLPSSSKSLTPPDGLRITCTVATPGSPSPPPNGICKSQKVKKKNEK